MSKDDPADPAIRAINAVIAFDNTMKQLAREGRPIADALLMWQHAQPLISYGLGAKTAEVRTKRMKQIVADARRDVAAGATHDCEEWRDTPDRRCALCDRPAPKTAEIKQGRKKRHAKNTT